MNKSIGLGLILGILHGLLQPVGAVPVVPNFTQGSQTSTTETKTTVSETINSINMQVSAPIIKTNSLKKNPNLKKGVLWRNILSS